MIWRSHRYFRPLLLGYLVSVAIFLLLQSGMLEPLEHLAYSGLFYLRGERGWDPRLVLVTIDDASLAQIGRFPWPRQSYIELTKILTQAQSSVIAIDLLWSEPSQADQQLAVAMAQHGRVVLAEAWDTTGLPLRPVATLQNAAIASGHILKHQDMDGLARKVDLQIQAEPSFGLATVEAYALVSVAPPLPNLEQPLWVNWPGSARQLQQYSFRDVIQQRISAAALKDKIVLVGVTASGLDPLTTPYDRNPPASGVHLQAVVIDNLLQQRGLHRLPSSLVLLLLTVAGPGLSLWLWDQRELLQLMAWLGLGLVWILISVLAFQQAYWLPVTPVLLLFTFTTIAVILTQQLQVKALLQAQVWHLWHTYGSDLIKRKSQQPDAPIPPQRRSTAMRQVHQFALLAEQFGLSQSAQAAITRHLSLGLVAAELDGTVWFVNPPAAQWLQLQTGDNLIARLIPNWLSQEQWQTHFTHLPNPKGKQPQEVLHQERWFSVTLEPLIYPLPSLQVGGEAPISRGLLLLLEDITPRKQIEANLHRQVQELQRLSILKDDFLSTVSHELRAPLANINMAIKMLKIARSEQQQQTYLKILQDECNREINLINDLLDLQRLESAQETFQAEPVQLQDWLPPILTCFYERAESRQQQLQIQIAEQLPCLFTEQGSLQRVVVELVNNACKYTPPNGEIRIVAQATSGQEIELVVCNSGSEIPAAELPRVFERFYRIPQADPWKQGGTGLGLSLVKKLVERLGGTIRVESGGGLTTFTVRLPIAP